MKFSKKQGRWVAVTKTGNIVEIIENEGGYSVCQGGKPVEWFAANELAKAKRWAAGWFE